MIRDLDDAKLYNWVESEEMWVELDYPQSAFTATTQSGTPYSFSFEDDTLFLQQQDAKIKACLKEEEEAGDALCIAEMDDCGVFLIEVAREELRREKEGNKMLREEVERMREV